MNNNKQVKGAIAWMANNSVAANILMLVFLVGGFLMTFNIKQEVFPQFELDEVRVSVVYPGASPEEVEQGVVLPIEEAIQDIEGIKKVNSTANEGSATVSIEVVETKQLQRVYEDVKNAVDRITTFAEDVEKPIVEIPSRSSRVITPIIYGNVDDKVLRNYTELIRDELLKDENITMVELLGEKPLEIKIDVDLETLRKYNLNIGDVATAISTNSKDVPAGSIKTKSGEILLRSKGKKYFADDFKDIPIKYNSDGSIVYLKDIATIQDSFYENDIFLNYNGMPAIGIKVYRVGKQTPIQVADAVKNIIEKLKLELPKGIYIDYTDDRSDIYKQRINLLLKNGYFGLALVFILLTLFLELRLAFWVTLGIPISFLGSFLFLPSFDVSLNMVSLFAYIISLGIVVDDAIVVGENIYYYRQSGMSFTDAAIKGAKEIAFPVVFSVLTNMIAFLPMFFIPGVMGKIFVNIPAVVITVFAISLIESVFILPAHIGHQKEEPKNIFLKYFSKFQQKFSNGFVNFINKTYRPSVILALKYRYFTIVLGICVLLIFLTYVKTGRLGFTLFPKVESDFAYISGTLPLDAPVEDTLKVRDYILKKSAKVLKENGGEKLTTGTLTYVNNNTFWVQILLTPPDVRPVNTYELVEKLRKQIGDIPGLENLKFASDFGGPGSGSALSVQLSHRNTDTLNMAAKELAKALDEYPIVSDIDDGFTLGKKQIDITLKPLAYMLGITPNYIARELRNRYYGNEAITQQRGRNELKITVRLSKNDRENLSIFENMIIKTPTGEEVPVKEIANLKYSRAYTSINRTNNKRVVTVSADVTPQKRAQEIISEIKTKIFPKLSEKYQGLTFSLEGKEADRRESTDALFRGLLFALLGIYVVLAIPFKSYFQPAIIMISIPFGIIGAVIGHIIMGYSLSLVSIMGIVAFSGVVVNDSLVLIDLANNKIKEGLYPYRAVVDAGVQRFRPVMLTTLTTFFGLMPMIFETSRQARFLIPMAISLGFGILFATMITLVLVPSLYIVLEDIKHFLKKIFR
ncbi:efflux RND transporter permease subunit [Deferribacterales bacterium Es71-Z0220]|uniref:efflux RND transporter permease subunit n=1 Tax=Deferrivibrio essentukiensis TaxID=2880922 RepID=UPI001F624FEB|nr:efflux RND transporter permease subunit [Deferrivibrio essentukiensis]MCB4204391.1 efflux RND transporter permease subunit [Deferrivibrio essentukiensis]